MRLTCGVEVTSALIVGLLMRGPTGSVAAATPGAGSGSAVSDTPTGCRAGTAIGQRIRGDYQDIPNWQNLHVFEISPVSGDRCVATIGNDQNVSYRVEGIGDLRGEESTCIYRAGWHPDPVRHRRHRNGFGIGVQVGGNGAAPRCARGPGRPVRRRAVRAAAVSG